MQHKQTSGTFMSLIRPAIAAAVLACGSTGGAMAAEASSTALSREEVRADLNLWNQAGVGRFADPDVQGIFVQDYQEALQKYRQLRHGPAYAQELSRLQNQGRQMVAKTAD